MELAPIFSSSFSGCASFSEHGRPLEVRCSPRIQSLPCLYKLTQLLSYVVSFWNLGTTFLLTFISIVMGFKLVLQRSGIPWLCNPWLSFILWAADRWMGKTLAATLLKISLVVTEYSISLERMTEVSATKGTPHCNSQVYHNHY